jgi:hypothetical protein
MNRRLRLFYVALFLLLPAVLVALAPVAALAQQVAGDTTTSPSQMSDYALYGILLGFVGTYVAAFINRIHWHDTYRFLTFFVWSVLASAGDAAFARSLDWHNWSRAFLVVLVSGIAFYQANKGAIKAFEASTS